MDAATLTAFRDRQSQTANGDGPFLLACQLGKNGPAAKWAFTVARIEARRDRAPDTHHTDTRIADRIVELVNLSDPATSEDTQDEFRPNDEFGEVVCVIGADDPYYRMWLYTAGTQFRELCGQYPDAAELADPMWRQRYDDGTHPQVVAQVTLHQRPMVLVDAGRLTCPVCRLPGEIRAEQIATRISRMFIDSNGIYAEGRGGTSDLTHTRTWCHECGTDVRLPQPIQEWT